MRKGTCTVVYFLLIGTLLLFTSQTAQSQSKQQMLKDFFQAGVAHGWQVNRPYVHPYYGGYPYGNPWYGWYSGAHSPYAYGPYGYPYAYGPYGYPPGIYGPGAYPPPWYGDQGSPYAGLDVQPAGRLTILVDPVDAKVRVDGKELKQMGDLSFQAGLLVGNHKVEARKEGYESFATDVEIKPGGGIFLPIQLNKK